MPRISRSRVALFALPLAALGCQGDNAGNPPANAESSPAQAPAAATAVRSVTITSPADGATVDGPAVNVVLEVGGLMVVPAGDTTANSGHHHLFLDDELSPLDQPVPAVPGRIVHLGTGGATYTFENVPPGEHRLIAVVADAFHVPLVPPVIDTIRFTVR